MKAQRKQRKKRRVQRQEKRRKSTIILLDINREYERLELYDKYLKLNLRVEDKMKLNPYEVKREIERTGEGKVESLVSSGVSGYIITRDSKRQSDKLKEMTTMHL